MRKNLFVVLFALLVLGFSAKYSEAVVIVGDVVNSTEHLGNFRANFAYSAINDSLGRIVVDLTNTSPTSGGILTAFAFNNPSSLISRASLFTSTNAVGFNLLGGSSFQDSISADPFANFDIGAGLGGDSFLGGGNPNGGILISNTATFTFIVGGSGLDTLNDISFVDTLTADPQGEIGSQFFITRFKGFDNDGSDKVPGMVENNSPVPEPATMAMLGMGVLGLLGLKRKA